MAVCQAIDVSFADGGMGGVEACWGWFEGGDQDVGREHFPEGAFELLVVNGGGPFAAEYLAQGMDPSVGSAGAEDLNGLLSDGGQCLFEKPLDGGLIGLDLPSGKVASMVS